MMNDKLFFFHPLISTDEGKRQEDIQKKTQQLLPSWKTFVKDENEKLIG